MPKITFPELKKTIDAKDGESILDAALHSGVEIPHACGGFGACVTCHVVIKSGDENLSEMEEREEERLERAKGLTLHSRLACQARVRGDVTVVLPK